MTTRLMVIDVDELTLILHSLALPIKKQDKLDTLLDKMQSYPVMSMYASSKDYFDLYDLRNVLLSRACGLEELALRYGPPISTQLFESAAHLRFFGLSTELRNSVVHSFITDTSEYTPNAEKTNETSL